MITEHLKSRYVQFERYPNLHIDEDKGIAYFMMFNTTGRMVGYQKYNPTKDKTKNNSEIDGRYYTRPGFDYIESGYSYSEYINTGMKVKGTRSLVYWGLETFHYRDDVLFVTEGIFDAVRLHNLDLPAFALLANNNTEIGRMVKMMGRTVIAICDNDDAGKRFRKMGHYYITVSDEKDLGAMSPEAVCRLLSPFL